MSFSRPFVAVMAIVSSTAHADVLFVDNCTRSAGGTDGGSFPSIQAAIDAAADGDEVVVAPCAYFETINFLGKAITVRSSDGPEVTIIDALGMGSVVTSSSGEGPGTILDGFTITGGNATLGGGMRNVGSSPTVTNCTFTGNQACPIAGGGGGMANINSSPTVTNCTFIDNLAGLFGGGMVNLNSSPTVTNCTFTGNWSNHGGGAMTNGSGSAVVTDCTFTGNTALTNGGGMQNGSLSSTIVTNCTFSGNTAAEAGGGMANFSSSCPTVINCTFTQNSGGVFAGGGIFNDGFNSSVTLVVLNCVLWDNFEHQIREVGENSDTTVLYSNIQSGWPGLGNINALPMFVDPDNGDLRLQPGSPCIDAGDNTAVPKGVLRDLDGHPRFVDDACSGHGGPVVDIGAHEFQGTSCDLSNVMAMLTAWGSCPDCGTPQACPADFDGDCSVGILDLLILMGNRDSKKATWEPFR